MCLQTQNAKNSFIYVYNIHRLCTTTLQYILHRLHIKLQFRHTQNQNQQKW